MRRRTIIATGVLIVLFVFAPVLFKHLFQEQGRSFTGVPISDLNWVEVGFRNSAQGIDLGGMLFVPRGDGPFPAAVVIHGSGTSSRSNGWYSTLAHDLVERGILVLLPDKRGSEESGGDWQTASFEDLATDTTAAVDFLAGLGNPRISRIGVIGMSQGGWIAPIAAERSAAIDYLVTFSGATVPPAEQLYYEEVNNLRQFGFLPGIAHGLASLSSRWVMYIAQSDFWHGVRAFDPIWYWQDLNVDALFVFGEGDTNVPISASIDKIEAVGNPRFKLVIFPGSGHAIEEPKEVGSRIIRPEASEAVANFILGL
jgi:dipeptidyl aminopeptidase/acylaminoacyl peptidase